VEGEMYGTARKKESFGTWCKYCTIALVYDSINKLKDIIEV